ncbi:hypothetical protein D7231_31820 [Streptomyces klenkii]|uniref:HK97 gp10 family phage protein n=1 Tax=Streptomyces klenkii TaxID=1420899 RepID=A0A3B0AMI7_9ACTN|nr:hypothetical protein [Streptomyces klenkii]RKN61862.1 hypothetical protein D7231_31820 [Streptomyces klenkii]
MRFTIDVDARGPLFDGRAAAVTEEYARDVRDTVAEFAEEQVLRLTGSYFRRPTGYYESRVETRTESPQVARVHDSGVVYGPWLEGTGSRNYPVTRFKGYGHWSQARELTRARAGQIAQRMLPRYTSRM